MKPHVHAEIIKQWADGAEIQWKFKDSTEWADFKPYMEVQRSNIRFKSGLSPSWDESFNYRVKPQETWIIVFSRNNKPQYPLSLFFSSEEEARKYMGGQQGDDFTYTVHKVSL